MLKHKLYFQKIVFIKLIYIDRKLSDLFYFYLHFYDKVVTIDIWSVLTIESFLVSIFKYLLSS